MKICSTCKQEKQEASFSKNTRNKDGLEGRCSKCLNKKASERYYLKKQDCLALEPLKISTTLKKCPSCKIMKSADLRSFGAQIDKTGGLKSHCKKCVSLRKKSFSYPPQENSVLTRLCSSCNHFKPQTLEFFSSDKTNLIGLTSQCKVCLAKKRSSRLQRILSEPEKKKNLRLKTKEANRKATLSGKYRAYYSIKETKRRQRNLDLKFEWSASLWEECKERFGNKCVYCDATDTFLTQDHFISLFNSRCIGTVPENMVPACSSCNSSKKDKDPYVWVQDKGRLKRILETLESLKDKEQ